MTEEKKSEVTLAEEQLAKSKTQHGETTNHADTARDLNNLGMALVTAGKADKGNTYFL